MSSRRGLFVDVLRDHAREGVQCRCGFTAVPFLNVDHRGHIAQMLDDALEAEESYVPAPASQQDKRPVQDVVESL